MLFFIKEKRTINFSIHKCAYFLESHLLIGQSSLSPESNGQNTNQIGKENSTNPYFKINRSSPVQVLPMTYHVATTSLTSFSSPPIPSSCSSTTFSTPSSSNIYAAAACAAAVAAAVASWSGASSPQSNTTKFQPFGLNDSLAQHNLPVPSSLHNQYNAPNTVMPRSKSKQNLNLNIQSPLSNNLMVPSPGSSNLTAAVAAAAAALSPAAAFYQRCDTNRVSTSNNSNVASPYSPR